MGPLSIIMISSVYPLYFTLQLLSDSLIIHIFQLNHFLKPSLLVIISMVSFQRRALNVSALKYRTMRKTLVLFW